MRKPETYWKAFVDKWERKENVAFPAKEPQPWWC